MSQFMTPAVTPDAVQSLAAGGQLLQEQYNQQQQNARTSAQIGAETRMHSESLAQDSAEKAAYRQHQSQITAAEIASRQTEASKERELRVRLAQTQMENEQRLAEIENAVTEAEISGNPEAIKQAHEAREAFVQSQTDLSAAETAHAIMAAMLGKAPGTIEAEFNKNITGVVSASKMFKDGVGSKFREVKLRIDANDPNLPLSEKVRAVRDIASGNVVEQRQGRASLDSGERTTSFLPNSALTRSTERFIGDVAETVMGLMGGTTRAPVSEEELRKHASDISVGIVSTITSSEEFGSIVEDPTKRAAAGSLMSQMAGLLIAKGGTYALKKGSVPGGDKLAENARPEIDNRIQDIAEELEKLGVTAQEQFDFFEAISEQAAGSLQVANEQAGISAAEKTTAAPDGYAGEQAFDRQLSRSLMALAPAYNAALGGRVQGTKVLEDFRDKVTRFLSLYKGTAEQNDEVLALMGDAESLGLPFVRRTFEDYGVTKYAKSKQNVEALAKTRTERERAYDEAKRNEEISRKKAGVAVRRKGQAEARKATSENLGGLYD